MVPIKRKRYHTASTDSAQDTVFSLAEQRKNAVWVANSRP